uniref:DUF1618 domain-containing protein n=1 Tax=Oryza glumipatula TaxID=40148 RepID=A0A0E0BPT2_9ORYZ
MDCIDEMPDLRSWNPDDEEEEEEKEEMPAVVDYSPHHRRRPSTFTRCGVIFDTDLIVRKPVEGAATGGRASHRTSTGFPFSVSLNLAVPPALSSIYLHCAEAVMPPTLEHGYFGRSSLVAADATHLLLLVVVPVKIQGMYDHEYPEEYFVYTADALRPSLADALCPTLTRLPRFPDNRQRLAGDIGILNHAAAAGDGFSFAVASLQTFMEWQSGEGSAAILHLQEMAKLSVLQCSVGSDLDEDNTKNNDSRWVVKNLAMPFDSQGDFGPRQWKSNIAFAYAGKLYWADYDVGLIYCDVLESSPKLQLIKFPVPVRKFELGVSGPDDNCGNSESFRTAGVSNGKIKFVDVDNCRSQSFAVTIRTWTLQMPQMVWKLDDVLDVKQLWGSASFKKYDLHQWVPEYPVVSLLDPHIVHFVLHKHMYHDQVWMIAVDMRAKSVKSCKNYPKGEKEDGYKGLSFNIDFICSMLSKS